MKPLELAKYFFSLVNTAFSDPTDADFRVGDIEFGYRAGNYRSHTGVAV